MINKRILIVDDDPNWADTVKRIIYSKNLDIYIAGNVENALGILDNQSFQIIIVELSIQGDDNAGLKLLKLFYEKHPYDPMISIVLTGVGNCKAMRDAFNECRITDFIEKSSQLYDEKLRITVERSLNNKKLFNKDDFLNNFLGGIKYDDFHNENLVSKLFDKKTICRVGSKMFFDQSIKEEKQLKELLIKSKIKEESHEYKLVLSIWRISNNYAGRNKALLKQLCLSDWSEQDAKNRIQGFIMTFIPYDYFPLSPDIVGPELILSSPTTSRIIVWSREYNKAIAIPIQSHSYENKIEDIFLENESKWEPEMIVEPKYYNLYGACFLLKTMKYDDFCSLLK